jgi:type I restriction enzyme, S subunit
MSDQHAACTSVSYTIWPLDRIKDHASKIGSGVTPTGGAASYLVSGVPLLRSQNIHFDGIRLDDVAFISEDTHAGMSGSQVRPGDVLLNITGASIGRCATVPVGFGEGNVNQHVCIIRPAAKLQPSFLHYCLSAPWGQDQILSLFTGASRQGLGQRDLGAMLIPMPPLTEQRRIAMLLDQSCKAIDDAIAAKREQLVRLDGVRETTIEKAVTHGLNPKVRLAKVDLDWIVSLPSHWEPVRVKRVLSRMDYGISESTERDGCFPVLKMGNVQGGELRFTNIEFVDSVEDDLILQADDILYNRTNSADQVGKAAIYRGSKADGVTFASYLVRLRANHRILPAFLNYAVNSSGFLSFARRLAIPSVQQSNLNSTRYGRMFVPLPPLGEQREICAFLEDQLAKLKDIASTIEAQIGVLTDYRKSLIHEYVTGQRPVLVERAEKAVAYG